jgi:hypothetical protein
MCHRQQHRAFRALRAASKVPDPVTDPSERDIRRAPGCCKAPVSSAVAGGDSERLGAGAGAAPCAVQLPDQGAASCAVLQLRSAAPLRPRTLSSTYPATAMSATCCSDSCSPGRGACEASAWEKLESHTLGFQRFDTRQLFRPFGRSSVVSQCVLAIVLHLLRFSLLRLPGLNCPSPHPRLAETSPRRPEAGSFAIRGCCRCAASMRESRVLSDLGRFAGKAARADEQRPERMRRDQQNLPMYAAGGRTGAGGLDTPSSRHQRPAGEIFPGRTRP